MLIGIDIGTGGCKVTVIERRADGWNVELFFEEYPTYHPMPNWCEQNPENWYTALRNVLRRVFVKRHSEKVDAVSLDGQTHAAVLVGDDLKPLRNSIIWTDQRSEPQCKKIRDIMGSDILTITYNPVQPLFTLPQIMWIMENEEHIWKRTELILMAKDYIRCRLTGEIDGLTDYTDAMGTLMFDARKFEWSDEILNAFGIEKSKLPKPVSSDEVVGYVSKRSSEDLNLPEGTPIVIGCHDVSAEPISAGAVSPGSAFVKLATAGVISITTSDPKPDPFGRTVTYCLPTIKDKPPAWFTKTATIACGSSYRWFRDVFCEREAMIAKRKKVTVYKIMDELAAKSPPGSLGLIYHPYLYGEGAPYYDPNLRASFFGITASHRKEHFCRAILEGVVFSIRDSLRIFEELGIKAEKWAIIGGGSRSRLWCQIVSDVLGRRLFKPCYEDASFGTAILAGIGIGIFKDYQDALNELLRVEYELTPDQVSHEIYNELYQIYKMIHDSLISAYRRLSQIQSILYKETG